MSHYRQSGFTLAELLIALGILGVIATFTIPKVLQGQADSKRKAVFRETVAAINQALYEGLQTGEIRGAPYTSSVGSDLLKKLNAVKLCATDSIAQGCFTQSTDPAYNYLRSDPGFVSHNGATVAGFESNYPRDDVIIDWNGPSGSGQLGDDQIVVRLCYATGCPSTQRVGTVIPVGTTSQTLFEFVFSN